MKDIGSEFCDFHSGVSVDSGLLGCVAASLVNGSWCCERTYYLCCQGSSGLRRIFGIFLVNLICQNEGSAFLLNVMNTMPRTLCFFW
jgi:hypothetical protein